jgi:hypothetical protein
MLIPNNWITTIKTKNKIINPVADLSNKIPKIKPKIRATIRVIIQKEIGRLKRSPKRI